MRIAVIADTHGRFPNSVRARIADADEIWHLGDFCDHETLASVRAAGPPVIAVLGNNDYGLDLPPRLRLERGGKTFLLVHIPPRFIGGADFLLHGHTHVPCDQQHGNTRLLNPGTVGKPNKGAPSAFGWLDISEEGTVVWTLEDVACRGG